MVLLRLLLDAGSPCESVNGDLVEAFSQTLCAAAEGSRSTTAGTLRIVYCVVVSFCVRDMPAVYLIGACTSRKERDAYVHPAHDWSRIAQWAHARRSSPHP